MTDLTFLGTGTSNGVPMIGCRCPVCTSADPRDRRSRTSALVRHGGLTLLIDTATELRTQALALGLDHIDAALFTHAHADHTGGFDDLRRFNELDQRHLPIYAGPETAELLGHKFAYALEDAFPFYGGKPDLLLHEVDGPFIVEGRDGASVEVIPIPVWHGATRVLGYRFGDLAYVTDAKDVPAPSRELLRGVEVLVLNALRERPHPTHLSLPEAVEIIRELAPREAYLVHISHELGHQAAVDLLPAGIEPAHDGLTIRTSPER